MKRKYVILLCAVSAVLLVAGAGANAIIMSTCNYDPKTGYYTYEGQEHAHGTMDSAYQCALSGLLFKIVSDNLGRYGEEPTKERAREIIKTNKLNKEKANE